MDISADHVRIALFSVIAFVVSVSVHEFGHAFVADRLGDRIPRLQGRLTLSPLAHIDPIGTIARCRCSAALSGSAAHRLGQAGADQPGELHEPVLDDDRATCWSRRPGRSMNLVLAVIVSVVIVVLGKAGVLSPALQDGLIQLPRAASTSCCCSST